MTSARLAAAMSLVLLCAACGIDSPSNNRVESFSGGVQPLSLGPVHSFAVSSLGSREITVTLTSLTPGNASLGILYGQPSGGGCAILQTSFFNSTNVGRAVLTSFVQLTGQYCVQLFDPVNTVGTPLVLPQNYAITVSHP